MRILRTVSMLSVVAFASAGHAQTAPQIPTPVNPFPVNPIATNGSPLPSQASKGSPYGYGRSLQIGRSVAVSPFVGEAPTTRLNPADARDDRDHNDVDNDGLESD